MIHKLKAEIENIEHSIQEDPLTKHQIKELDYGRKQLFQCLQWAEELGKDLKEMIEIAIKLYPHKKGDELKIEIYHGVEKAFNGEQK